MDLWRPATPANQAVFMPYSASMACCLCFCLMSSAAPVWRPVGDKIPMGSAINRGLTFRTAQTPVQHYLPMLLDLIESGDIDPSEIITHRAPLEDGRELYKTFRAKKDGCVKVVLKL